MERCNSEGVRFPTDAARFACPLCVAAAVLAFKLAAGGDSRAGNHRSTGRPFCIENRRPVDLPRVRPRVPPALYTRHRKRTNTQSIIESVRIPNGKASSFQNDASTRRPCRAECALSLLENAGFAHRSCRCSTPSRGRLSMCRCAWSGDVGFPTRKVTCATHWPSTRKLTNPTRRSARHGGNLPIQKCCFPNWETVVLNSGAPALVNAESLLAPPC